jgi:hypothetical protein
MSGSLHKVEAFLPRRTFPVTPAVPEHFEYAFTNEGDLPSTDLLDRSEIQGTKENLLRLIARRVIHPDIRVPVSVDYSLQLPDQTNTTTYMTKSLPPKTELQEDFQWISFKYLPNPMQIAVLSLRSRTPRITQAAD